MTIIKIIPIKSAPPTIPSLTDLRISAMLASIIDSSRYQLPGCPETDTYIVPVSGGADSTVLAIVLRWLFPAVPFKFVFTDTTVEEEEIYFTLDLLEAFLNVSVDRVQPAHGLFELIDLFGGFLPSARDRWCTRMLKLETFQPWLALLPAGSKHIFVGIRSDEENRLAFAIDEAETHMPFIDLGLVRSDIYRILTETIGVPRYYRRRTRSGCFQCFFQRRTELIGLSLEAPEQFERGASVEKLNPHDQGRHQPAPALWTDSGIAENWQQFPLPSTYDDIQGKNGFRKTETLFGDRGIWIAAEFFFDGWPGIEEFIWQKRIVSYSPTKGGLTRQIDDRFMHLRSTSELYDMTPDDIAAKVRFGIWYVELSSDVFDPDGPSKGSYTWQQGESYNQVRHTVQWATRALHAEGLRIQANQDHHPLTVQYEWTETSKEALTRIKHEVGRVVASQWYVPKEPPPQASFEGDVALVPCPLCHI